MTTGVRTPTAPRRSRARTFLPLGVAAWLLLEIWLLTLVAGAAGGFTVFALLVAGAVLGAVVIKKAGRRAFRNLTEAFQQSGATPAATPADRQDQGNGLLMLGGLLLMLPGLISDAAGLLLLLPPVRRSIGRHAEKSLERRMRQAAPGSLGDALRQARIHRPDAKVVQGEVIRQDPPAPPQPGTGQHPPLTP
ncbi:FxsA family membrane protein [Streptomyces sp. NPDC059828]|uniref:FxsA family membrane protein n=1 Tax=Streptomyces sp. NPDC059828 TaxID=3346965 RepID=UPI003659FE3E